MGNCNEIKQSITDITAEPCKLVTSTKFLKDNTRCLYKCVMKKKLKQNTLEDINRMKSLSSIQKTNSQVSTAKLTKVKKLQFVD